jgi:tetratricopeptide (TPR) repeat protein
VALKADLANEEGRVSEKEAQLNKQIVRLGVDLANAQQEKGALGKELEEVKKRLGEIDGENQWLRKERKDINAQIKDLTKKIETQQKETNYDKQYLKQKVKNAKADRMMFEAKAGEAQQQAAVAEAKLKALGNDLEKREAQTSLQESEIMVLREEKSKLEQKLIRYIEKIIESEDSEKASKAKGAKKTELKDQVPRKAKKRMARKDVAQRKLKMHYNLALAYDKQGMYREEEKEYLKCLSINSLDANVHYNLAILYDDKLNQNKKAIEHYMKFLELRPVGEDVERVKTWMLHAEQEDRLGPAMK